MPKQKLVLWVIVSVTHSNAMKYVILIILLTSSQLFADLLHTEYYESAIKVNKAEHHQDEKMVKLSLGTEVSFQIKIYETEFFEKNIVSANANIKNKTENDVYAVYSIAFFDAQGRMLGCVQCDWDLPKNQDIDYGSGLIYMDSESVQKIESIKVLTSVFDQ